MVAVYRYGVGLQAVWIYGFLAIEDVGLEVDGTVAEFGGQCLALFGGEVGDHDLGAGLGETANRLYFRGRLKEAA